ncbi:unnamed protein product [Prorocentrum cordatum]|uniref:Large ribosomal subunit protein bL12 C-terminal domain-containing protein n=1 Tax=Prorocentrum cordatum TaxID=2364126 RepID=A0ABN9R5U3_9DINO|nr:unnamed protein product [Polarella glacialis]
MMAAPAAGGGAEEEKPAEKTEFDLVLKEVPKDKKIAILKVVRTITGLGLKEAKGMVDNPGKLLEAKPKDICEAPAGVGVGELTSPATAAFPR